MSNEAKLGTVPKGHSPAPWEIRLEGGTDGWIYSGNDLVAQVYDNPDTGCEPLDEAPSDYNMKLIAAAPELLSALMELRDWYCKMTGLPAVNANAAIVKAAGTWLQK